MENRLPSFSGSQRSSPASLRTAGASRWTLRYTGRLTGCIRGREHWSHGARKLNLETVRNRVQLIQRSSKPTSPPPASAVSPGRHSLKPPRTQPPRRHPPRSRPELPARLCFTQGSRRWLSLRRITVSLAPLRIGQRMLRIGRVVPRNALGRQTGERSPSIAASTQTQSNTQSDTQSNRFTALPRSPAATQPGLGSRQHDVDTLAAPTTRAAIAATDRVPICRCRSSRRKCVCRRKQKPTPTALRLHAPAGTAEFSGRERDLCR